MELILQWKGGIASEVTAASGYTIRVDGSEALGGSNSGARPMELVLTGLMGCAAIDVLHILKKMRLVLADFTIQANARRADAQPAVFEWITLSFKVKGNMLSREKIEQAIQLSVEKYCSVAAMLTSVNINWTLSIEHQT